MARDLCTVADHPLCGCAFVVHVARVDVGALLQQVIGYLDGAGEMQRSLSIATTCVDERRVRADQLAQRVEHPESRGGVRVHSRAATDQELCEFRVAAVEDAEAAGPPIARALMSATNR